MARMGGRSEEASAHFEAAIQLFESSGAAHPAARVSARLGVLDWNLGRLTPGIGRMERAFAILVTDEPDEDLARLAAQLGRLHYFAGDPERAMARTEVALGTAERLVLPEPLSEALNTKGLLLVDRLRLEEGQALLDRALRVALGHDIPSAALRAYNNLAYVMWVLDRAEDAYTIIQPAVELARRVGDRPWEWALTLNGADSLISLGRWDEAFAVFETVIGSDGFDPILVSVEITSLVQLHTMRGDLGEAERVLAMSETEASEDFQARGVAAVARSMILRARGDLAGALKAVRQVTEAVVSGVFSFVREAHVEAAEIALALGDLAQAEDRLNYLETLAPVQATPLVRAQASRLRARLLAARGEDASVEAFFKSSVGLFRELSMRYWLAVALAEQGEWLIGQGRTEDASPLLDEARGIFERLGARPWRERVERLTGPSVPDEVSEEVIACSNQNRPG
jgi:tetratricopeptide (TPR) repeat protein